MRRATIGLLMAVLALELVESALFALVTDELHRTSAFIGILVCVQGVGGLLGGLFSGRLLRRTGELAALGIGAVLLGVGVGALATAWLPLVFAGMPVGGFGWTLLLVAANTLTQRRSPDHLVGRVSAAQDGAFTTGQVASLAAGAGLVAVLDSRLIMLGIGVGLLVAAGYLWLGRRIGVEPVPQAAPAD